ncbi:MAG: SBBP repeat-containing protein, partial [Pirellulales bacterium]|nr:SBBP repeat-containing protein [Pirellulales bacterium]
SDNVHVRDGADLTASSVTANTLTIGGVETCTWNGGGGDNLWTTAENWTDDVAPLPGDNLVFPGDAARLENVNDFPAGTVFGDIVVEGGDYSFQNGSVNAENVSVQNNARLTVASIIAGTISIGNVDETTFWSTFLGGDEDDMAYEIVVDDAGNSFLVGATYSPDFPASDGFDPSYNDDSDAFVAKFAPTGELLWSTYLGGSSYEHAWSATLDAEGNILVTGMTASGDFPVTSGSFDTSLDGETDAFIAKFSSSGELLWATYLGGSMWDQCNDIAVDNAGNIFVIGDTYSDDLPALGGFDTSFDGNEEDISDGFVAKLNSSGMAVWVSYLGGSDCDWGNVITVDHEDNILLSGLTFSGDFPAYQGFDMTYHDGGDVFLVKLTNSGDLLWATFLGGSARDQAEGLTVDADGQVFVGGITYSEDFPTLGGFDASLDGACDAFLAKITTSGQLLWASYIGGSDQDWINDIAIDETGDLFVTGRTYSGDFPLSGGFDSTLDGECDAFVAKINSSAGLTWSSYFGGSNFESGSGIALDHLGNVFLTGRTTSGDLPTTSDCFDSSYNGENDVYLAKIHIKETGDVRTWDGGGEDNQWSTAENWAKGETPLPGDGLVFPAEADTFVCVNDFPAGTVFGEIVVEGGDYSFQNNGLNAESVQVQGDASLTVASIAAGTLTIGEGEESGVEGRRSGVESRGSKVESRGSGVESRVASGESSIRPTTGNQRLTVLPDPQVLPITSAQRANDLLNDWPVGPIDDYVLPYSPGRCPGLGETGPFGATGVTSVSIAAPVIRVFRLEERGQVDNLSHVGQVDNLSHAAPVLPAFYAMYASAEDALHRTSRFPTFDDSRSRAAYETPRFNWSWLDDLSESRRKKRDALREQLVFSAVDELFGNL